MDQKGSLVDTKLKIYPSIKLLNFINTLSGANLPPNILKLQGKEGYNKDIEKIHKLNLQFNDTDYKYMMKIKEIVKEKYGNIAENLIKDEDISKEDSEVILNESTKKDESTIKSKVLNKEQIASENPIKEDEDITTIKKQNDQFLLTTDIEWLYNHLKELRKTDKDSPFLHTLIEGSEISMPENRIIKRNPILEARCVKLRAQQEAREYRKMTKTVDNVRLRFPEDSISYQLKQLNRQLIAIAQFLLSIFAGFLFGFKGVEWMIGHLDFGFRLLLGVMCALVIALAEIYFLAKKLNEELNVPETVQLGGPPKFAENSPYANTYTTPNKTVTKEHQD